MNWVHTIDLHVRRGLTVCCKCEHQGLVWNPLPVLGTQVKIFVSRSFLDVWCPLGYEQQHVLIGSLPQVISSYFPPFRRTKHTT